jgi:transposase
LSYKKTRLIPGKVPSESIQEDFVNKLSNLLLRCIDNKKHKLFFFDPVHQTHNNENDRGWMKKGAEGTRNVLSNTGRRRVNIIGGLNALELEVVTIVTEANCNKELMICYLEELKACNLECEKIYLVLDNASYNRAYEVKQKADELGMQLIYLPPYCPNLNIIERLWKFFKKKIMKNKYYEEFNEFLENIYSFFKNIKKHEKELYSLLALNFQIIKAN